MDKLDWTVLIVWLVMLLLTIAFWAGIVYVALHFIMKVW